MQWGDIIAAAIGAIPVAIVMTLIVTFAHRRDKKLKDRRNAKIDREIEEFVRREKEFEESLKRTNGGTDKS